MILPDFLYYLVDENGKSYRVKNGIVGVSGVPTALEFTPDGWQDKAIKFGRNNTYFGLFRSFTTPLKLVKDGAKILRHLLYTKGFEAKVFLVILRLDKSFEGGWIHRPFYKGEIDFSKAQDEPDFITVNIMEGDLIKLLKANENTTYEIALPEIIKHDGVILKCQATWEIPELEAPIGDPEWFIPITNLSSTEFGATATSQVSMGRGSTSEAGQYFIVNQTEQPVTFRLTGPIAFHFDFSVTYHFLIQKYDEEENYVSTLVDSGTVTNDAHSVSLNFLGEITLDPGERLLAKLRIPGAGGSPGGPSGTPVITHFEQSTISLSGDFRFRETNINAIGPVLLGQALIDKIAPGYTFTSEYLETWKGLKVTSGDAIRALEGAILKTSWTDFYNSYNVPCNLSLTISGMFVIVEEKVAAFGQAVAMELGEVKNLNIQPADDFLFNTLKIGYPDVQLEDVNGRSEFNVTTLWTSNVKRVVKELSLVSAYRASMFDQEFIRINLDGKLTTNSRTDNSVHFIHCNNDTELDESGIFNVWTLKRVSYDSITGVYDPSTAYNIEISPKRCLIKHGNYLRSVFYFQQNEKLVFQTSDKNALLTTTLGTTVIKENQDVNISSLDAPLFIPLTFECDSPMPKNAIEVMESTPNQSVSFLWDGIPFYGYPMEIGIQPANRPAQQTIMLCRPDNDLTQLIH